MTLKYATPTIGQPAPAGDFAGWRGPGDTFPVDDLPGYHVDEYFRDGQYIGADMYGVEPVYLV